MDIHEAMEMLSKDVSGYFCDNPTELGIEHMREDYLPSKSHLHWVSIKSAFETMLEGDCPETDLSELVRCEFNRHVPLLPGGARGFLTHIYKSIFEEGQD